MSVTNDPTKITFGQSNDSMVLVHKFLRKNGINNVDWVENKFDEKTALALLYVGSTLNCIQFIKDGGFNSERSRYKERTTVIIGTGAKYYSSPNAQKNSGIIAIPTTGVLVSNGLLNNNAPLNPLLISLMKSPIEEALNKGSLIENLTGDSSSTNVIAKVTKPVEKDSKMYGGYSQGELVYLRPESVIPSFSDILIGDELSKIMKVGSIVSKGIEMINSTNVDGNESTQFLDDSSNNLNKFLNKDNERLEKSKEIQKKYNDRIKALQSARDEKRIPFFYENGMFIKNLITDTIIYIPFRPDGVDESYSISWSQQSTRGSSHETFGYESTSGSSPSISFEFDVGALSYYMTRMRNSSNFNGEYGTSDFGSEVDVNEELIRKSKNNPSSLYSANDISDQIIEIVINYLNALKALAYPLYTDGIVTPPSCYVSIARNFRFIGICTNVNISHKGPLYIKPRVDYGGEVTRFPEKSGDHIFMSYSITLSFNKIVNQDFSADTVEVYGDNWTGGVEKTV